MAVESLNPSLAMEWFIKSIPALIPNLPDLALSTLLHLLPDDLGDPTDSSSNLLFDEDPINEYTEDVVVLQHICSCLRGMLAKHEELISHQLILDHLDTKSEKLSKKDEDSSSVNISAWENPKQFMKRVRCNLLHSALGNVESGANKFISDDELNTRTKAQHN